MQMCAYSFKTHEIQQVSTVTLVLYNIASELDFRVCFCICVLASCDLGIVPHYFCLCLSMSVWLTFCLPFWFVVYISFLLLFPYYSIKAEAALSPHLGPYLVPVNIFLLQGGMRRDPWGTMSVDTEKHPSQTSWHALNWLKLLIGRFSKLIR